MNEETKNEENVESIENNEATESIEENGSEELIEEETKALTVQATKMKKHHEAKKLVEEAKNIVQASESQLQDCKLLLEEDLREYKAAKDALMAGGLTEAKALLSSLDALEGVPMDADNIVFEAKEDVHPLVLKEVHSGRFTGTLFSFLGGALTFSGLVYWATEKLGITVDLTKVPSTETIQSIFGWFGTQIGQKNDATLGAVAVGAAVLSVMAVIYLLRVWLKSGSNLHFAQKQMKEAQKYITHKSNCKAEMDRVDAHIGQSVKVLKDYEVLLYEQAAKLKRIVHFEKGKEVSNYSKKSMETIHETQQLVGHMNTFISTPMSYEGGLSNESSTLLEEAKVYVDSLLEKWQ